MTIHTCYKAAILAALGLGFSMPQVADARPVSYPGGWTSMLTNNSDRNAVHIHYSPTAKYSVGYKLEYWRDDKYTLNAIQVNNLLKRWNQRDSQATLYLKSGIGVAHKDTAPFDSKLAPAAFTGFSTDWENRRFFVSYENRYTEAGDIDDFYMQSTHIGIAPYIGDYGDLHTWLMLEVDHTPEGKDPLTFTPMVRFFKGVYLLELGVSDKGKALFNWVIRY